ncbi:MULTISPECIES: Flp pilus assembly protein CpaB [Paenibacillus]|uniref:Flp pilus assembly protein CpaB n=1 Tax=Paenibacillus TaxID=44249 RepID=UPI0022B88245|nr:Flp pilus assembly protein CpaB [Paenibacillus caseinilyticus]MCZ8521589.1 Flp pilus assembly protein CpaB [Paenibacillus caseinilyticus]
MRSKLILAAAVAMGLCTTFLFFNYMKKYDAAAAVQASMVEVVAVKSAVKKNGVLDASVLELVQVPELGLHPQAVRTIAEAEGKLAAGELAAGEVLLSHHLAGGRDESLFVSRKVKEGYRGVSVGVNFVQSVSNLIEPEDTVDVIWTPTDKGAGTVASSVLLERVRVLAVGRRMVEAGTDTPYAEYSAVTLEVKAADAPKVVQADELGTVSLVLQGRALPAQP